jgi:hypothetical protein
MKLHRLNGVLIALAVLAVLVIGRLIPQQGETILLWLLSAGVGIAVLLRPVLGLYLMVGLIPLTNEIVLVEGVSTSRIVGMAGGHAGPPRTAVGIDPRFYDLADHLVHFSGGTIRAVGREL